MGARGCVASSRSSFFVACLIVSASLTALSIWKIRAVTLRQTGRPAPRSTARPGPRGRWLDRFGLPQVSLDASPVLWRKVSHRPPSRWALFIWRLYAALSMLFALVSIFGNQRIAPGTSAFMVSIGLLLVSTHSATMLAEERSHGSLDVLLTTPLRARSIVLGKWWGAFRPVPKLAVLPGLIAFGVAVANLGFITGIFYGMLITALVMAYGALVTSVGLAIATWQPRLGRAIGLSVAILLVVTVFYPAIGISVFKAGPDDVVVLWPSPFFGILLPMIWVSDGPTPGGWGGAVAVFVWTGFLAIAALSIRAATIRLFDRLLGRMSDAPGRRPHSPRPLAHRPSDSPLLAPARPR